jgi:hypothetical protein
MIADSPFLSKVFAHLVQTGQAFNRLIRYLRPQEYESQLHFGRRRYKIVASISCTTMSC